LPQEGGGSLRPEFFLTRRIEQGEHSDGATPKDHFGTHESPHPPPRWPQIERRAHPPLRTRGANVTYKKAQAAKIASGDQLDLVAESGPDEPYGESDSN
jgi:hypothetical protein